MFRKLGGMFVNKMVEFFFCVGEWFVLIGGCI